MDNQVVAHFLDGSIVKGVCFDFSPTKPVCHIQTLSGGTVEARLEALKALFFVKDFRGDPTYQEARALDPADPRGLGARSLEIEFRDGEILVGLATGYSAERPFFFLLPADPRSNNSRVFVNRAAVAVVKLLAGRPAPSAAPRRAGFSALEGHGGTGRTHRGVTGKRAD